MRVKLSTGVRNYEDVCADGAGMEVLVRTKPKQLRKHSLSAGS